MSDRMFAVDGIISTNTLEFDQMDVIKAFVGWLESVGWEFGGTLGEVDDDGNYIRLIPEEAMP